MGISIAQVAGTTATAAFLTHVPPGATVFLATNDTNADMVWGFSSAVTFTTGAFIPVQSTLTLVNPATSAPFDIWVISGTGGHEVSATVITRT